MNKIINFHRVTNMVWLDNIICYLKSKYKIVNATDLYAFYKNGISLNNTCHITIDDGDKSFYDCIFPILKKHNVPASIFVSPKIITEKSNYWFQEIIGYNQLELKQIMSDMSKIPINNLMKFSSVSILKTYNINQIHEIIKIYQKKTNTQKKVFQNMTVNNLKEVNQSKLITIGAHTLNHPILQNEDDNISRYEIKESIFELSTLLNQQIKYFAYPNGIPNMDFTLREKTYLRELDIHLSFTTEPKNFSIKSDTMCIPRMGVTDSESMPFFKTKMFLGSLWSPIIYLKPTGEINERKELIKSLNYKA
ncbi:MAG TPA: polysaccharide deacetylase family protein [Ignavibacteriaceae bacterium]|nr:polysaccharide deacetylase family protein [Ignavibacteriaceae bacterium]